MTDDWTARGQSQVDRLRRALPAEVPLRYTTCVPPDTWFACEQPERPPEGNRTGYHEGCRGCAVAAEARARHDPTPINVTMAEYMRATVDG